MAITNRATVRAEVSALFDSVASIQTNYGYPPVKIKGESPIVSIHDAGTIPAMISKNVNQFDHFFILTIYVNREAHGAEAAESVLDGVFTDCMQAIRDVITGTSFMEIVATSSQSQPFFATIDGVAYRVEEITIMTRSNPNG